MLISIALHVYPMNITVTSCSEFKNKRDMEISSVLNMKKRERTSQKNDGI